MSPQPCCHIHQIWNKSLLSKFPSRWNFTIGGNHKWEDVPNPNPLIAFPHLWSILSLLATLPLLMLSERRRGGAPKNTGDCLSQVSFLKCQSLFSRQSLYQSRQKCTFIFASIDKKTSLEIMPWLASCYLGMLSKDWFAEKGRSATGPCDPPPGENQVTKPDQMGGWSQEYAEINWSHKPACLKHKIDKDWERSSNDWQKAIPKPNIWKPLQLAPVSKKVEG